MTARRIRTRNRILVAAGILAGLWLTTVLITNWADPTTSGSPGSSEVTTGGGLAAWHDILRELELPVSRSSQPPGEASFPRGAVLIAVAPGATYPASDTAAVRRFVEDGGRLITTPDIAAQLVEVAASSDATPGPGTPSADVELDGVERLPLGRTRVSSPDGMPLIVDSVGRSAVLVVTLADGDIVVMADWDLLDNDSIGDDDSAVLAVRLTDGRPTVFDESLHAPDRRFLDRFRGFPGLIWALFVAMALWVWSGRRVGPVTPADRSLPPPRAAYLEAVAASLAGKPVDDAVAAPLKRRTLRLAGQAPGRLSEAERAAATGTGTTTDDADVLVSALARLENESRGE